MSDADTDTFKRTMRAVVRAIAKEAKGMNLSEATVADLQSAARAARRHPAQFTVGAHRTARTNITARVPKLLTDAGYRADLLRHVENPAVLDFFINTFARWSSSFREEAISPVLNKCRAFLTGPLIRATIGQTRSSFNFRWLMDHRKVLLCDLSKAQSATTTPNSRIAYRPQGKIGCPVTTGDPRIRTGSARALL